MAKMVHAGELNRRVEILKKDKALGDTGERLTVLKSLGFRNAKRVDVGASEVEEGKLIPLNVCRFIMRYRADIMDKGAAMHVRDFDGVYDVTGVSLYGDTGKKKFVELKCVRDAKSIVI